MRHRVYGKHLGRDKNQRTALFRGLVRNLLLHRSIETTEAKAKAIKGLVDKLVSASKKSTNAKTRVIEAFLTQKDIREKLAEVAATYSSRTSGFTTSSRVGIRSGDGAMIVRMSFVDADKAVVAKEKPAKAVKESTEEVVEGEVVEEKPKKTVRSKK